LGIKGVVQSGIAQLLFSRICTAPAQAVLWKRTARALRDAAAKTAACRDAADIASAAAKMRSSCLRQAGAHSVPDWGLVR